MPLTLEEKIEQVSASLRKEEDPAKYSLLANRLAILTAAKKDMDDEDDLDDDEEDEKKSRKSAKKSEEKKYEEEEKRSEEEKKASISAKKSSKRSEEEEEEEEEEESKKASAALAFIEKATGRKGSAAIGAAAAVFARLDTVEKTANELAANAKATEKATLIASVKKYVPKAQIDWLQTQHLSVVRGFVETALKGSPMVHTESGDLLIPKASAANTKEALPKDIQEMIDGAVAALPGSFNAEQKQKFEATLVQRHLEDQAKALNGAGGRY